MEIRGTTSSSPHHPAKGLVSTTMATVIHQADLAAHPPEVRARLNGQNKNEPLIMGGSLPETLMRPAAMEKTGKSWEMMCINDR
jgi:hypothetical protein